MGERPRRPSWFLGRFFAVSVTAILNIYEWMAKTPCRPKHSYVPRKMETPPRQMSSPSGGSAKRAKVTAAVVEEPMGMPSGPEANAKETRVRIFDEDIKRDPQTIRLNGKDYTIDTARTAYGDILVQATPFICAICEHQNNRISANYLLRMADKDHRLKHEDRQLRDFIKVIAQCFSYDSPVIPL